MNVKKMENIAQKAREVFLRYEGVLGVGYGVKRVKDKATDKQAIIVYVEQKLPPEKVKKGELIPRVFSDFPTDVEEVRFDRERDKADGTELYEGRSMAEFLDWGKIHRLNLVQKKQEGKTKKPGKTEGTWKNPPADLNTPVTEVRGNLFVIDDDGTLVYTTTAGVDVVDFVGAWNLFRAQFDDDYDFAVFFLDNTDTNFPYMGNFSQTIFRDSSDNGYGAGAINNRSTWGGSGRLLRMVCHSWYSLRTMLHEVGHQWLFYANYRNTAGGTEQTLLHENWDSGWDTGQKWYHPGRWPDNDRSCMDYEHQDWIEVTSGVYRPINVADANFNFCPLDQYLMGFLHPEAVASSRVDPLSYPAGGDFQIINSPALRTDGDFDSTPVNITAQNIIWNEGARAPGHLNSPRVFHQAVIAITFDRVAHAQFLTDSETRRHDQADNWRRATSGRSVVDTSLLRNNIDDVYIRDNISDTGGVFPGGDFWNSPDIFVRNHDDDPNLYLSPAIPNDTIHEKPKSNQDNWVYTRVHNKSGTAYDNVTVKLYIANYHGFSGRDTVAQAVPRTEVIYPIDWHPDSLIGSTLLASVPVGGTAVAKVLWKQADIPPAVDWHPCLLAEIVPLGTEPTKLHHVWDNRKLAQKNIEIEYIPADNYEFDFPFVIGHAISSSRFAVLELLKDVDLPGLQLYLDPRKSLGEVREIGGTLFHRIAGLEEIGVGVASPTVMTVVESGKKEGLILTIPRNTSFGIGYAGGTPTQENPIRVTFCEGTRLLLQPWGIDYRHLGFLAIEGLARELLAGKAMLRMVDARQAKFPISLAEMKEHEMKLKVRVDGRRLEQAVNLHLVQRDEIGKIVGGIDLQLRPKR